MYLFFFPLPSLGGYETFNSQYPECCVDGKLISPERTEAERNLASHCEKQSANHKPAYDQVCVTAVAGDTALGSCPSHHWALPEAGRVPVALLLAWAVNKLSQPRLAACVLNEELCVCCWSASPPPGFKIWQQKEEKTPSSPKTVFATHLYHIAQET